MLVEARRHENPDLGGEDREGQTGRPEEGDLDLGKEHLGQVGIDEMPVCFLQEDGGQRLGQEVEDVLGKEEADAERNDKAGEGIEQALAQLDQMVEQRHLLVVFGAGQNHALFFRSSARRSA